MNSCLVSLSAHRPQHRNQKQACEETIKNSFNGSHKDTRFVTLEIIPGKYFPFSAGTIFCKSQNQ